MIYCIHLTIPLYNILFHLPVRNNNNVKMKKKKSPFPVPVGKEMFEENGKEDNFPAMDDCQEGGQ